MSGEMTLSLALAPLVILGCAACLVLLVGVLGGARARGAVVGLSVLASAATFVAAVVALPRAGHPLPMLSDMWIADRMALVFDLVIALCTGVTVVVFRAFAEEHAFQQDEFPALVLFSAAGMVMVVHACHLVSLLVGIETMSLAAYVLVASRYHSEQGSEGALKYFLMGALASGFLVYGIALVYGTTGGEMSLAGIASRAGQAGNNPLFVIGMFLILVAQSGGRAVSHVAARRVPRRTDAGDGLHGGRNQGGGVRRHASSFDLGFRASECGHGTRRLGAHLGLGRLR
jgi:NADH-quinone oxidoreductase subunit N